MTGHIQYLDYFYYIEERFQYAVKNLNGVVIKRGWSLFPSTAAKRYIKNLPKKIKI